MNMETSKFTRWQMIALALLRIMIGWHFLYEGIAKMLKVRLSEARKLHRLEGTPQKGEDIQAALKRYAKPAEKKAKPEGNASD